MRVYLGAVPVTVWLKQTIQRENGRIASWVLLEIDAD